MAVSAPASTTTDVNVTSTPAASAASDASVTSDRFLKLLVAQMQNQDPLNPMDNAQVTSQMAQINTVTGIDKLNATVQGLSSQFMQLIAGPDLAQSTAQPHQLLDFVAGRLSRHFIGDARSVEAAMSEVDRAAGRDGWHRVHSFFCRADTWQAVLARMVAQGDVVLM